MTVFRLPDLGEGLPDAEIVKWWVEEGQTIEAGETMVEMSTAKAVVEVPAPHTGEIIKLHGGPGDVIDTGSPLVTFGIAGKESDKEPPAEAKKTEKPVPEKAKPSDAEAGEARGKIFLLPDLGEGLPDAEIVKWMVKEGDQVSSDELMVEMSTAKAVVEVGIPFSGTVVRLYGGPGDIIETGAALIEIATGEAPAKASQGKTEPEYTEEVIREDSSTVVGAVQVGHEVTSESSRGTDGIRASAAVRALARKSGIDLASISGSGIDGEVTLKDIRAADKTAVPAPATAKAEAVVPTPAKTPADINIGPAARSLMEGLGLDVSVIKPTGPRGSITKQDVMTAARGQMAGAGMSPVSSVAPQTISGGKGVRAAPKVRALARDLGVNISAVRGSGVEGSITLDDVNAALKSDFKVSSAPSGPPATPYGLPPRAYEVSGQPEKLVGPRRVMAQLMARASAEVCKTSIFDEADIDAWLPGNDVTVRLMRSIIAAAMVEPAVNAWFDFEKGEKTTHPHVNLGVAVDSPKGLFVPVLKGAEVMSGPEMRAELNRLRQAISDGKIQPSEMSGGTITMSNFGMIAGRFATPIVSPPEIAIIGIGGLFESLVMTPKGIENHRIIPISVTFDHRACTGGEVARFLAAIIADLTLSS